MSRIHLLPPEIISKIAAGEVIERPASVVKELLENSLDAQATAIELNLKNAGKTLIQIKDNGTGIDSQDIEKVFLRHSTSKISSLNDLYEINSLGFRGEALYSIASISDITLRSKTKSQDTGWEIHLRADKKIGLHPVSIPDGTTIEVQELFFNTPARKKFLKSDTTELKQILNIFIPYALLYPQHRFTFIHNDKTLVELAPESNYTSRIANALNLPRENLIEAQHEFHQENISIHLVLGDINIQRSSRDLQFIFINGRPVQSRSISFNLNQIYRLLLPDKVNPFFAAFLRMPAQNIDVNVHPTKREVKIKDEAYLLSILRSFCENTLMGASKPKQAKGHIFTQGQPAGYTPEPSPGAAGMLREVPSQQYTITYAKESELAFVPIAASGQKQDALKDKLCLARYVGTFQKTYLLFETPSSLLVIDQHAAWERIVYEKLKKQIETGKVEAQQLLQPALLKLSQQEILNWETTKDILEKMGFTTNLWDKQTLAVHSHPQLITNPEISVRNILSDDQETTNDIDTLARRACRQSIMAGDQIGKEQIEFLRSQLLKCAGPFTCPHGRPTVIEIPDNLLKKQFLR